MNSTSHFCVPKHAARQSNSSPTAQKLLALRVCVCSTEVAFIAVCIQSLLNDLIVYRCLLLCFQGDFEKRVLLLFLLSATLFSQIMCLFAKNFGVKALGRAFPHTLTARLLCYAEISPLCIKPPIEKDHVSFDSLVNIINDAL